VDVAWLQVFREVARHGSLTAAARALGYTQSAISRQIAALEAATGARLLDRLPRGVRLTEEGRCLLGHAGAVLDRLDAARRDLEALRDLEAGRLRVGAFASADSALVPRALAAFGAAHPKVALSVVEGNTPVQLARLWEGEVDIAVVSAYPHQTLDADRFDLRLLADDPLIVALPRGHRLAHRRTLRLAELAGERWIEGFPETSGTLVDACRRAGFEPRIDFAVREWTAKQGFVAAGLGLTLVPMLAATAVRPDVVLVPLHRHDNDHDDAPVRTVHAATRRGATKPPATAAFLEHLARAATQLREATWGSRVP
jgi:DNA-binding transcriptional LysR family regulator